MEGLCIENRRRIKQILTSYGFRYPTDLVRKHSQITDNLIYKILSGIDKKFSFYNNMITLRSKIIESHSIKNTLKKGFALVKQDSHYVKRLTGFEHRKSALLKFYDGDVEIIKRGN